MKGKLNTAWKAVRAYIIFGACMMGIGALMMYLGIHLPREISLPVLLMAVVMDFLTTYLCLKAKGREGNPIVAALFKRIGIAGTFAVMVCIWVAFIYFRWWPSEPVAQTIVAIVYWIVPINNTIVLKRLTKRNRLNRLNKLNKLNEVNKLIVGG